VSRTVAIVQARMSSDRFPGKMLAPFRGQPLIRHVVERARAAVPQEIPIVVATSDSVSDDPLAAYAATLGISVFRGPLDDVFRRFLQCAEVYPCDWILRINGDSPFVSPAIVRRVLDGAGDCDVVTTTFPRTFPRGLNVELIRLSAMQGIDPQSLNASDREHVTAFFYRHPKRFTIVNIASEDPLLSDCSVAVDTLDDLRRLERLSADEERRLFGRTIAT